MNVFLLFAFNAEQLREHLREPWMSVYDYQYIDDEIIGGVERNLPSITEILKQVEKRATGKITSSLSIASQSQAGDTSGGYAPAESKVGFTERSGLDQNNTFMSVEGVDAHEKKVTKPEPFNLTKPKPKMIPVPEAIKREVKANPVPKTHY